MQSLEFIAPDLVQKLKIYQNESNKLNICYIEIYDQLLSTIEGKFTNLIDMQKADLQKELISIDGRKNFIKNYQDNKEYCLLIDDAIAQSTPEYEEKIKQKLQKLDEFMTSISLKQCK